MRERCPTCGGYFVNVTVSDPQTESVNVTVNDPKQTGPGWTISDNIFTDNLFDTIGVGWTCFSPPKAPSVTKFNSYRFRIATNGYMFILQERQWWWPFWEKYGWPTAEKKDVQELMQKRIEYLKTQGPWRAA